MARRSQSLMMSWGQLLPEGLTRGEICSIMRARLCRELVMHSGHLLGQTAAIS